MSYPLALGSIRIDPPWIIHADGTRDHLLVNVDHDGGARVWVRDARLDDVRACEARYARLDAWGKEKWATVLAAGRAVQSAGGTAHARPTHAHDSPGAWWEWHVDDSGLWFDWVKEPDHAVCHDLGQHLYRRYRYYMRTAAKRVHVARLTALAAMEREINRREVKAIDMLRLTVNGRDYLWSVGDRGKALLLRAYGDPTGTVYQEWVL